MGWVIILNSLLMLGNDKVLPLTQTRGHMRYIMLESRACAVSATG